MYEVVDEHMQRHVAPGVDGDPWIPMPVVHLSGGHGKQVYLLHRLLHYTVQAIGK